MLPDATKPGTPQDWLRHAASDLAVASQPRDSAVLCETLCYHAQQAVEKSIKAVLLSRGVPFSYTHDLAKLITILQEAGIPWRAELDEAADLTRYAVQTRYPGMPDPVTDADLRHATKVARSVLAWAEGLIHEL